MTEAAFTSTPLAAQVQGAVRPCRSEPPASLGHSASNVNSKARAHLAARACAGDRDALFDFFVLVRPSIEAFLISRGAPVQDMEDLLHDTCLVLLRYQSRLRPVDARELQSCICTMAHNVLRDSRRSKVREERRRVAKWWTFDSRYRDGVATDEASEPAEAVPPWLLEALASLSEIQRDAIYMKYFLKMGHLEIARRLEITPATARKRISLAYAALRRWYRAEQDASSFDRE